jgi:hypothetical protein
MIRSLKNLSLRNKLHIIKSCKCLILAAFIIAPILLKSQQIANYVNNGGFEVLRTSNTQQAKFWSAIDTTKYFGLVYSATVSPYLVPLSSLTYQWPKGGANYLISSPLFKPNTSETARGYPRNILKQTLQAGKTYCVKFYCNVTTQTSYGVDGLGAFFGDSTTDTISQCMTPITYLTPQIENPTNNIITDTLNWVSITGTFVANGTEKYMILGNFKSDAATNTVLINPANLPLIACDFVFDNVSCIDIDLPAYAGSDAWILPGDSIFIGRQPDVGIDEACMWFKMPNTTTAIDTVAGLWVKPTVTTSYLVRQEICGNVKWDLVTVYISATGLEEYQAVTDNLKLYPQPATNEISLSLNIKQPEEFNEIEIYNNLGSLIKEQEVEFVNKECKIKTDDLTNGIYILSLKNEKGFGINKRLVIAR